VPLTLELQTERGEVLDQLLCGWALDFILTSSELERTICLRFIDPYGNTIFNRAQAPILIQEIQSAAASVSDASIATEHKAFLNAMGQTDPALAPSESVPSVDNVRECTMTIVALARRCEGEVHTYLKFIGD
jgi:hypothetical protein